MSGREDTENGLDEQQIAAFCGNWPGVVSSIKWEVDRVFTVAGKMFCVVCTIGPDRGRFSFKVDTDRFLELTEQSQNIEYTVSWIDVTSTGKNFARGIFMQGDHAEIPGDLKTSSAPKLTFPLELPGWVLNGTTVGLFNAL